jgi:RNA polymerase sigma-70 factor (ECF subfamily)
VDIPVDVAEEAGPARLEYLVREHLAFVLAALGRAGVRDGDIEDAAQRVFLTAARKIDAISPDAERAFLKGVARREASHARRSYQRRGEVGEEGVVLHTTPSTGPDELVRRKQALLVVARLVDAMDPDLRAVFMLHELDELTVVAIAKKLGLPLGTVKTRLRRARGILADHAARLKA